MQFPKVRSVLDQPESPFLSSEFLYTLRGIGVRQRLVHGESDHALELINDLLDKGWYISGEIQVHSIQCAHKLTPEWRLTAMLLKFGADEEAEV